MMFSNKKRAEALIAQSLYEPLDDAEQAELQTILERSPELRSELESMRRLVNGVPADEVRFGGNLAPAIMAQLAAERPAPAFHAPRWALTLAAFVLVASGVAYWIAAHPPAAVAPGPIAANDADSGMAAAFAAFDARMASRDYAGAYTSLARTVSGAQDDAEAGRAYQLMADLAFDELQWYPEAFAGYDALRHRYVAQFQAEPENFTRLNLLDETRGPDDSYARLRALDAARRGENFGQLEEIASRNPASYIASAASNEMAMLVARQEGLDPGAGSVAALRMAEARATNQVAKLQLQLEIAHALAASPADRESARDIYTQIADGPNTTLAEAARKSLAVLDETGANRPQL